MHFNIVLFVLFREASIVIVGGRSGRDRDSHVHGCALRHGLGVQAAIVICVEGVARGKSQGLRLGPEAGSGIGRGIRAGANALRLGYRTEVERGRIFLVTTAPAAGAVAANPIGEFGAPERVGERLQIDLQSARLNAFWPLPPRKKERLRGSPQVGMW